MKRLCASIVCLAPILSAAAPSAPGGWEELPALTADPAALLALYAGHPFRKDAPVLEHLYEMRAVFDAAGLRTRITHQLYRVEKASDFNGWDSIGTQWSPWFEDRPEIRARVISPQGAVALLDPATIGEYGAEDESSDVYGDRKGLRAPLPKVVQGALVELEIITRERAHPMDSGRTGSMPLYNWLPTLNTRVILEAPESLPLVWKVRGESPAQPQVTVREGRRQVRIVLGPHEPAKALEPYLLPERQARPIFRYATAPDWNSLAREYAGIVEARIKGADLAAWVQEAVGTALEPDDKIARILARLHKDVRYTGVEFGQAALIPGEPGETLKRGYGDCKDKAALLVALLRTAGIEAQVALLEVGGDRDLDPELPGFGAFNHAIVHLPGPTPRWIDATAEYARLGELPLGDYGRLALVAAPGTQGLTALPELESSRNRSLETRTYRLVDGGPSLVKEITETWGPKEMGDRDRYAGLEEKSYREGLKKYVKEAYSAKDLGAVAFTEPRNLAGPFKLDLEVLEPATAATDTTSAAVAVNFWPLVKNLNREVQALPAGTEDEQTEKAEGGVKKPKPRKEGLYLPEPECTEMRVLITPPPGYAADSVPKPVQLTLGPASFSIDWRVTPEGTLEGHGRLDTSKRRWTAEEVNQAREALTAFGETKIPMATFRMTGEAHLEADRLKEALAEFRKLAAAEPVKAAHRIRIARALLQAGLGEEARRQAEKAVQLDPSSSSARNTQGWILQHDLLGRRFGKGWDPAGSEKAYRKAKELDPHNHVARLDLAILLEHNAAGERYVAGSKVAEAVKEYQELRKDLKNDGLDNNLLSALGRSGRFQEALAFARELKPSPFRNPWRLAMVTCLEGAEAALKEAASAIPDAGERRTALVEAGDLLPWFRRYAEASRLLLEGSAGMENLGNVRSRAEALTRTRTFDSTSLDPQDPGTPVTRLRILAQKEALSADSLQPLLSPSITAGNSLMESLKRFRIRSQDRGLPVEVRVDLALSPPPRPGKAMIARGTGSGRTWAALTSMCTWAVRTRGSGSPESGGTARCMGRRPSGAWAGENWSRPGECLTASVSSTPFPGRTPWHSSHSQSYGPRGARALQRSAPLPPLRSFCPTPGTRGPNPCWWRAGKWPPARPHRPGSTWPWSAFTRTGKTTRPWKRLPLASSRPTRTARQDSTTWRMRWRTRVAGGRWKASSRPGWKRNRMTSCTETCAPGSGLIASAAWTRKRPWSTASSRGMQVGTSTTIWPGAM
jgi:transglutaminase-like putative cysteine protease/tetratricopeptide (TPR) repeat protein